MTGKIKRNLLRKRNKLLTNLSIALIVTTTSWGSVYAIPVNKDATGATVTKSDNQLIVNQTAKNAMLNWNSFNIAANEKVTFNQPGTSAVAFNKILDNNASQIMGRLSANGHIFLQNPNGIVFAPGAKVDVGGLVATTLQTKIDMAGDSATYTIASGAGGKIINNGDIIARNGYVSLLAPQVENYGNINAAKGININTGVKLVSYDLMGDGKVTLKLNGVNLANTAGINEANTLSALDGMVVLGGTLTAGQAYAADGSPAGVNPSARNEIYGKGIVANGEIVNLGGGNSTINATGSALLLYGADLRQTGKTSLTTGEYFMNSSLFNNPKTGLTISGGKQLVSGNGLVKLPNGNLVIYDPAWSGNRGMASFINLNNLSGNLLGISSANSLVGTYGGDKVSSGGIVTVGTGGNNYLVVSPYWQAAPNDNRGAVTWASGAKGIAGTISENNSLVGSTRDDQIGSNGIYVFKNGNYLVLSPNYDYQIPGASVIDCGAITWGDGNQGVLGTVDASQNSLLGAFGTDSSRKEGDKIGQDTTINTGAYVNVYKSNDNTINNNIAMKPNTRLHGGIVEFNNGDYAIDMPDWNGGTGAVVFAKSTEPLQGRVSTGANGNALGGFYAAKDYAKDPQQDRLNGLDASITPVNTGDQFGSGGIIEYNGKYIILSPNWGNGRGLVSLLDNSCTGTTTYNNVLVKNYKDANWVGQNASIYAGVYPNSFVGSGGLADLGNGKLAILSPQYTYIDKIEKTLAADYKQNIFTSFDFGKITESTINSFIEPQKGIPTLIGTLVGGFQKFYVSSQDKTNLVTAALSNAGAVTVVDVAKKSTTPLVNTVNSLIGAGTGENFGSQVKILSNNNMLVADPTWDGNRGALAFIKRDDPAVGNVSEANSLVAHRQDDRQLFGKKIRVADMNLINDITYVFEVGNSNYLLLSPNYTIDHLRDNNPLLGHEYIDAGIAVWGNGTKGTIGSLQYGFGNFDFRPRNFYSTNIESNRAILTPLLEFKAVKNFAVNKAVQVNRDGSYDIINWNYDGGRGSLTIHADGNRPLVGMVPKNYTWKVSPQAMADGQDLLDSRDKLDQYADSSLESTEQMREEGSKAVDKVQNNPVANQGNIIVDSAIIAGENNPPGNLTK
ncbi:MAG TPA: filamentous hemagglutinin N-terminal domain-containing protein [Patescibacteria group bacterium]|nr:filamentous hemagglutinin N-terminal domain-containing protein [Patescibacteria group bacterium]